MVRLKVIMCVYHALPILFQFHYGTIKSLRLIVLLKCLLYFNSTMVRLKETSAQQALQTMRNFNSTMVRLKGRNTTIYSSNKCYFNSTMVRLKDQERLDRMSLQAYFNSTMVRLKESKLIQMEKKVLFQFHYGTIKRKYSH